MPISSVCGATWSKLETYKEKPSTEGSSDLHMECCIRVLLTSEPVFLRQSFPSVSVSGARKEGFNVHLHMSLAEFPLHLILITSIEVGLDRDHGLAILFPARGSFVLDVHSERSTGWE